MSRSGQPRVLVLVLAGGAGGRLDVLTDVRAKPAMPYAGVYRLIDFPLSNCSHSRMTDVWVLQQYQPHSLSEYLAGGRPWDLDRTYGGFLALQPFQGRSESGWYEGNADAIWRHKVDIERFDAEVVVVLSADHVYRLDYREPISRHLEAGAEATLVTTQVPRDIAGRHGVVEVGDDGSVTGFEYKPEQPRSDLVTTEVFVYDPRSLLRTLEELAGETEEGLEDFGHGLIPRLVDGGRVVEHRLEGYWRDVGTVRSYWEGHMDLLAPEPALALDDPAWPLLTRSTQRAPALVEASARMERALVSQGAVVAGTVSRSVLGPGVRVEAGAEVRDSVLLGDCVVAAGAHVVRAVLDEGVRVGSGAAVGEGGDGELALLGAGATVSPGERVPAGGRRQAAGTDPA